MSAKTPKRLRNSNGSSKGSKSAGPGKRKKKNTPKQKYRNVAVISAGILVLLVALALIIRCSTDDGSDITMRAVEIPAGTSVHDISMILRREGVISSAWGFRMYVRRNNLDRNLQSGTYRLPSGLSVSEAAGILSRGYMRQADILVYPGLTAAEIARRVSVRTDVGEEDFLREAEREAEARGFPFVEGFFFPGSYRIPLDGFCASGIIREAFDRFQVWENQYRQEIEKSPYSLEEIVITASMIQREAGSMDEMPIIAGIIWKRLELGMPLGIDATTRYELDDWQNPLRREDLERMTPYNTRRRIGLPPTGISNPGKNALLAALRPSESPYLYYLHDRTGRIHYGITYQDHLKNIEEHLK